MQSVLAVERTAAVDQPTLHFWQGGLGVPNGAGRAGIPAVAWQARDCTFHVHLRLVSLAW